MLPPIDRITNHLPGSLSLHNTRDNTPPTPYGNGSLPPPAALQPLKLEPNQAPGKRDTPPGPLPLVNKMPGYCSPPTSRRTSDEAEGLHSRPLSVQPQHHQLPQPSFESSVRPANLQPLIMPGPGSVPHSSAALSTPTSATSNGSFYDHSRSSYTEPMSSSPGAPGAPGSGLGPPPAPLDQSYAMGPGGMRMPAGMPGAGEGMMPPPMHAQGFDHEMLARFAEMQDTACHLYYFINSAREIMDQPMLDSLHAMVARLRVAGDFFDGWYQRQCHEEQLKQQHRAFQQHAMQQPLGMHYGMPVGPGPVPVDHRDDQSQRRPSKKRARHPTREVIKCHQCGITETPEWRRGPDGARTLCNACGLYHAKLVKKKGETEAAEILRERRESRASQSEMQNSSTPLLISPTTPPSKQPLGAVMMGTSPNTPPTDLPMNAGITMNGPHSGHSSVRGSASSSPTSASNVAAVTA